MAEFVYIAKDQRGESMEGVLDAASRSVAASQLRERGWVIISIRNQAGSRGSESEAREWVANPFVSIRSVHVETSLQQLALMVKSGMTLLASIEACKQQTSSRGLARVWAQVANDIQKGGSFHQALEAHRCFPEFVVRLVAVGEKTGNLEQVLRRASTSLKNRRKARDDLSRNRGFAFDLCDHLHGCLPDSQVGCLPSKPREGDAGNDPEPGQYDRLVHRQLCRYGDYFNLNCRPVYDLLLVGGRQKDR